ncbi:MAG TPA: phage major capsid protein [Microthrixaceae bacterium]|nr:phage major capsid protein [Microthrixaceae bacterium]
MSGANDQMLADLTVEIEEKRAFQERLVEDARSSGRDLTANEMELYQRATARMEELEKMAEPVRESARIATLSTKRNAELAEQFTLARRPDAAGPVEYRSAGAYVADMYYGQLGDADAQQRLSLFQRAAAHQTTADNPGLLPESIVAPIVNFIEVARPITNTLGPQDLGSGSWSYARVTQHTLVGLQAGEKTELASRKMTVTKTPLGADTYGGYVNVSKQDINRSSPSILDMVINDLAQQYAIETEEVAGTALTTAATAGPTLPAGPDGAAVAAAIWGAAGQVFAATKGQGTTVVAVSPDMLGAIGPIFPNVNPTNAYSTGFPVAGIGQGAQGTISGLTVIMSAGLVAGTILVYSTAAAKAFEYRYGNLQVVEPSVWGVQVGYAGDFDAVVIEPAGVVKITQGV